MDNTNVTGQPVTPWGAPAAPSDQTDQTVQSSATQNAQEVSQAQYNSDTLQGAPPAHSGAHAAAAAPAGAPDAPALAKPSASASDAPMTSAGGNPWTDPSGFVAALISLNKVASTLARNSVADSNAIVKGEKAQYEEGVDAGVMAKDSQDAQAAQDIIQGIGSLVSAGISTFMTYKMVSASRRAASEKEYNQSPAGQAMQQQLETKANSMKMSDEEAATLQTRHDNLEQELQGYKTEHPNPSAEEQQVINSKQQEMDRITADLDTHDAATVYANPYSPDEVKAAAGQILTDRNPEFAKLQQKRDEGAQQYIQMTSSKAQTEQQTLQMAGQALSGLAEGFTKLATAPAQMIQGEYEMWQQIYQTASQIMGNFVSALQNDMQSQNQMIDSVTQLSQKAMDDNARAMSSGA